MRCLNTVRFNMIATVLNRYADIEGGLDEEVKGGHWEWYQDEETGALGKRWIEDVATPTQPGQTHIVDVDRFDIECTATGFPEVGFRSSANTESYLDGRYLPSEVIKLVYPAKYVLSRRQFVTNIRGRNKQILWLEEETGQPTVFEVQGVTPTFDPYGRHIDNLAVIKRARIQ